MTLTGILFLVCSLPVVQVLNKVFPLSFKFIHKISIQEKFLYFQIASRAGYNTFGGRIRPAGCASLHYTTKHTTPLKATHSYCNLTWFTANKILGN